MARQQSKERIRRLYMTRPLSKYLGPIASEVVLLITLIHSKYQCRDGQQSSMHFFMQRAYLDSSIGIRYSCRMASCGSCGMKINGIPRLACYTKVSELVGSSGSTITCEPLSNFPHIRDLVTDFSQFFNHHKDMSHISTTKTQISKRNREKMRKLPTNYQNSNRHLKMSKNICNSLIV